MTHRFSLASLAVLSSLVLFLLFALQGCNTTSSDDKEGSGANVNGRWEFQRVITEISFEGEMLRDTMSQADFGSDEFSKVYLVVNATSGGTPQADDISVVSYNHLTMSVDTTDDFPLLPGLVEPDSLKFSLSGNTLVGTTVSMDDLGFKTTTRMEFTRFTETFPPVTWGVLDTVNSGIDTSTVTGELWLTLREIYTWSNPEDSGVDTIHYDTSDAEQMFFLNIRGDDLYVIDYDGEVLFSRARLNSTTWRVLGSDTLKILSQSSTQMVFTVSGYDAVIEEHYMSRVTLTRYNGTFPPPAWSPSTAVDANEPNNTAAQATSLIVGATAKAAALAQNDVDWYSFEAQAGATYTMQTFGNQDTYIELYAANGTSLLEEDDDSGADANGQIVWTATSTGTFNVQVRGFSGDVTGPYTVQVTQGGFVKKSTAVKSGRKFRPWAK